MVLVLEGSFLPLVCSDAYLATAMTFSSNLGTANADVVWKNLHHSTFCSSFRNACSELFPCIKIVFEMWRSDEPSKFFFGILDANTSTKEIQRSYCRDLHSVFKDESTVCVLKVI